MSQISNAQFMQILPSIFKKWNDNAHDDDDNNDIWPKKKKLNQDASCQVKNIGPIQE